MADWAKSTAAAVRAGDLDPAWRISVRTRVATGVQAVDVTVVNATPETMLTAGGDWTDQARALTETVLELTANHWWTAHQHPMRFFDLHFGPGCPAPPAVTNSR